MVGFRRRAGRRPCEGFAWRQLNAVGRGTIKGASTAVMNSCAGRGDKSLDLLDRRDDCCRWRVGDGNDRCANEPLDNNGCQDTGAGDNPRLSIIDEVSVR